MGRVNMPKESEFIPGFIGPPKITNLPSVSKPSATRVRGGNLVTAQIRGVKETEEELRALRQRVGTRLIDIPEKRAASIQARLQGAIAAAYHRAATGRMARGIRARVTKTGAPGERVTSVIRISMMNYREARFLTNIGGGGYFKDFPIRPYRIFAKGVEPFTITDRGTNFLVNPHTGRRSIKHTRKTIGVIKQAGVGRLKVPRRGAFITAARKPGRGGGESRIINDVLGPAEPGESSAFFFYPLWVDHPGFDRDVISEVALDEGARYQDEVLTAVTVSHGQLKTRSLVASRDIPLAVPDVEQVAGTIFEPGMNIQVPAGLLRSARER